MRENERMFYCYYAQAKWKANEMIVSFLILWSIIGLGICMINLLSPY